MKPLLTALSLLILVTTPVHAGETVDWDDLVEREGLYFKKFSDVRSTVRFDALKEPPQLP
mgnify:CR=1 FL=1